MPDPVLKDNLNGDGTAGSTPAGLTDAMSGMTGGAEPETKPDAKTGETDKGTEPQNAETPAWMSQLPEGIRNDADVMKQLSKFQKVGDLAKSYTELETRLGKSIVQPGKDSTPEEVQAFYEKLGKPKDAKSYGIETEGADAYKDIAFKYNLTDDQATGLFKELSDLGIGKVKAAQEELNRRATELDTKLHKEYGSEYEAKLRLLQRGVNAYGGKELGDKLRNSGLLYDESIVRLFIRLGEMGAEPGAAFKGTAAPKKYKSIAEGGTFDYGLK